jgi:hypothetical protein
LREETADVLEQGAVGVGDFDPVESALLVVLDLIKKLSNIIFKINQICVRQS